MKIKEQIKYQFSHTVQTLFSGSDMYFGMVLKIQPKNGYAHNSSCFKIAKRNQSELYDVRSSVYYLLATHAVFPNMKEIQ